MNNGNLLKETAYNQKFYLKKQESKEFQELQRIFKGNDADLKSLMKLENYNKVKAVFGDEYKNQVLPGQLLNKNMGNIYTGSLYLGILSLLITPKINLMNKRIMMFSYGSGCAATLFVLKVKSASVKEISERNADVMSRLQSRIKVSPHDYDKLMSYKETLYNSKNYSPKDSVEILFENAFYLEKVDEKWRRHYVKYTKNERIPIQFNKLSNTSSAKRRLAIVGNHLKAGTVNDISTKNEYASLPSRTTFDNNVWSGFYKKSIYEKILHVIFY